MANVGVANLVGGSNRDEPEALMDAVSPADARPAYKHHNHTQKAFEVLNVLRR